MYLDLERTRRKITGVLKESTFKKMLILLYYDIVYT